MGYLRILFTLFRQTQTAVGRTLVSSVQGTCYRCLPARKKPLMQVDGEWGLCGMKAPTVRLLTAALAWVDLAIMTPIISLGRAVPVRTRVRSTTPTFTFGFPRQGLRRRVASR